MRALLISTYELGRQPFGLASPAAWLRDAGCDVECVDATREPLHDASLSSADLVGFHLPMHTATRLAGPLMTKARRLNRRARLCAYGLYAPPNESWLRSLGVDDVLGGEFEAELTAIAHRLWANRAATDGGGAEIRIDGRSAGLLVDARSAGLSVGGRHAGFPVGVRGAGLQACLPQTIPRLHFLKPDRSALPSLTEYATLHMPDGRDRLVGSTEASRGCRHLCRHCPVVPIYNGQFRIVQPDVVLADIAAQVEAGAEHISFGDPDFFNGPTHAMRIVDAMHACHPHVTYDVTIKVEHLLRQRDALPRLVDTGCVLVTTAVESLDDRVLARLDKGHTRRDFLDVVHLCGAAGLTLVPTFVAFHPWLSLDDYCELLDTIARLNLVEHVAPIQLAIRLLVPEGSRLLELEDVRQRLGSFDPVTLVYPWMHEDPRVDELHRDVTAMVGTGLASDRGKVFDAIRTLAHARAGQPCPAPRPPSTVAPVPYLDEPWYCCAEPNPDDLRII